MDGFLSDGHLGHAVTVTPLNANLENVVVLVDDGNVVVGGPVNCQPTISGTQASFLSVTVIIQNDAGAPIDLSLALGVGGAMRFRVKDALDDVAFWIDLDILPDQTAPELTLGRVDVTVPAAIMATLPRGRGLWQIQVSLGDPVNPIRFPKSPGLFIVSGAVV